MKIAQTIIDQVRDSADIVDVVSQYVDLNKEERTFLDYAHFTEKKHHLSAWLQQNKYFTVLVAVQEGMYSPL